MMDTLRSLYEKVPKKWRARIIRWVLSFSFAMIIKLIWGIETLLTILIFLIFIAALFRTFGLTQALKIERLSIEQFIGHIRGMVIFAFLPVAWELIKDPSISSIIGLLVILLCVITIWDSFGKMINNWGRTRRVSRRKRRR